MPSYPPPRPVSTTMAAVSPLNPHPDVKLGLLLVVSALILHFGSSGPVWAYPDSDWSDLTATRLRLLSLPTGLGGFFVVFAAIWVDRRFPHEMMAASAGILALGLALLILSPGFVPAAAGLFLVIICGSAVGSLIFYSVAVKGYARYKGALIGALGLVFEANLRAGAIGTWAVGIPIGWIAVMLVLIVGIFLFILLPRWFQGTYEPGPTLRETIVVPGVKARIVWATAVYLVAAMIIGSGTTYLRLITASMAPIGAEREFGYQALALAGGIGALAWGVAADFFSVRRLLIALTVLSLPAAGWGWLLDDPDGSALLLSLVRGGLISLPWVLMADLLPRRHFAKLALAITWLGSLSGSLGWLYWGAAVNVWGVESFIWTVLIEAGVLVAVALFRPKSLRCGS